MEPSVGPFLLGIIQHVVNFCPSPLDCGLETKTALSCNWFSNTTVTQRSVHMLSRVVTDSHLDVLAATKLNPLILVEIISHYALDYSLLAAADRFVVDRYEPLIPLVVGSRVGLGLSGVRGRILS